MVRSKGRYGRREAGVVYTMHSVKFGQFSESPDSHGRRSIILIETIMAQ